MGIEQVTANLDKMLADGVAHKGPFNAFFDGITTTEGGVSDTDTAARKIRHEPLLSDEQKLKEVNDTIAEQLAPLDLAKPETKSNIRQRILAAYRGDPMTAMESFGEVSKLYGSVTSVTNAAQGGGLLEFLKNIPQAIKDIKDSPLAKALPQAFEAWNQGKLNSVDKFISFFTEKLTAEKSKAAVKDIVEKLPGNINADAFYDALTAENAAGGAGNKITGGVAVNGAPSGSGLPPQLRGNAQPATGRA